MDQPPSTDNGKSAKRKGNTQFILDSKETIADLASLSAAPPTSSLTASQLDRKRANDRQAQRATRAKTKSHIAWLEREVQHLQQNQNQSPPNDEVVQQLLTRNQALENELTRLREHIRLGLSTSTLPLYLDAGALDPCRQSSDLNQGAFDVRLNSLDTKNEMTSGPSVWNPPDDQNNSSNATIPSGNREHYHQTQDSVNWVLPMATPRPGPAVSSGSGDTKDRGSLSDSIPIPSFKCPPNHCLGTLDGTGTTRADIHAMRPRTPFSEHLYDLVEVGSGYEEYSGDSFSNNGDLSMHTSELRLMQRYYERQQMLRRHGRGF